MRIETQNEEGKYYEQQTSDGLKYSVGEIEIANSGKLKVPPVYKWG